jgi:4-hydroxybenzoyl-CoA thioesterase
VGKEAIADMSRVKFEIQGSEVFRTRLRVRVDDVNYGGHLGNDSVLTLCHEARLRFFAEHGQSEANLFGKAIIMSDAMVIYRAEASLGDELDISIHLDDIDRRGFDLYYGLSRGELEIARVKTGLVFFDYEERKVVPCPEAFLRTFSSRRKRS